MAAVNPEDVVRSFLAAEDRRDVDAAAELLDPDFVEFTYLPEPIRGREAMRQAEREGNEPYREAFPGLQRAIVTILAKGDTVAVELEYTGTFRSPLKLPQGTFPPTGQRLQFPYSEFYRVNPNGLIGEARVYLDRAGWQRKLSGKT